MLSKPYIVKQGNPIIGIVFPSCSQRQDGHCDKYEKGYFRQPGVLKRLLIKLLVVDESFAESKGFFLF